MKFKLKPWQHQLDAIERVSHAKQFALFFEMGTGKTGTAINILRQKCNEEKRILRTLIFCPPVVIENWKKEFAIHSEIPPKTIVCLTGAGVNRLRIFEANATSERIFVTNYEALLMKDLFQAMCAWKPDFIICDESHKLKDATSKRSKLMDKLVNGLKPIPYRLILTGTPVLNSPSDMFGQFLVLDGGETFTRNQFVFRAKYFYDANAHFKAKPTYFPDWQIKPKAVEEMNELIGKKSMTVKKSACLDLPPLVKKRIYVEMTPDQGRMYWEMNADLVTYMNGQACVATLALTKALRLLQIASGYVKFEKSTLALKDTPKMAALKELLESLAPDHKILVWAVFKENYNQIRQVCDDLKLEYAQVHGEIPGTKKMAEVERFTQDPKCRVFIGHPGSGGIGINLIQASYAIFYSRNFSLEYDLQAEARNYRGGSEMHTSVTRIDLVAKGTIEEMVLESLENKQQIGESLLKSACTKVGD